MRFWKAFAWISLLWVVVARRGAGLVIKKKSARTDEGGSDDNEPRQQSGPGWRRVATTKVASRGADPGEPAGARTADRDEGAPN